MPDLSRLVEQEIPRLRRYARALTHAADRADDLVQDTLVRALSKLHLWQPGTDLRAWLFTIMHHQYVNTVRREARERTTVDIEHVSSTLAATTDPTVRRQLLELDRALARLPRPPFHPAGGRSDLVRQEFASDAIRHPPFPSCSTALRPSNCPSAWRIDV
jgi:RNA polymerase sigma factor (sigma-70 family)